MHVALLGDSTLDNGAYTSGGPAVIDYLNRALPAGDLATLVAVDGATTQSIPRQIEQIPNDATHAVLSVGGNDALQEIGVLDQPAGTVAEALTELSGVVERFETEYRACLDRLCATELPVIVCAIYNGAFDTESGDQRVVDTALSIWNDVILQAALDRECPLVDLRRVCNRRANYTHQIEPNEQGGRKIAAALRRCLVHPDSDSVRLAPTDKFQSLE